MILEDGAALAGGGPAPPAPVVMPELVRVEVGVQPDREDAERDDAAVEVAAHFFVSLSRGASAAVAAVVKTCEAFLQPCLRLGVVWHFGPINAREPLN